MPAPPIPERVGFFEKLAFCRWKPDGKPAVIIPVREVKEEVQKRIIQHERANRPGARLESTGRRVRVWTIIVEVHSGSEAPEWNGFDPYPFEADKICDSFEPDETGDLTTPTRGVRRCKAQGYSRIENADERDCAALTLQFHEDNEDDAAQAAFAAPSVSAAIKPLAFDATEALEDLGVTGDFIATINALGSQLEEYASAPDDYVSGIEAQATALMACVARVQDSFLQAGTNVAAETVTLFSHPQSSRAGLLLAQLADTAGRAVKTAGPGSEIMTRTYSVELSIFDVAIRERQDVERLMALNRGLPDLNTIPKNTPIRILTKAA